MADNDETTCMDIEQEIATEGLLRADDIGAVPAKLVEVKCAPQAKHCFVTPIVKYVNDEVEYVQLFISEGDESPRYVDKLRGLFPDAPESAAFSFSRKLKSFTFGPNKTYSDWISGQELDLKVLFTVINSF